MIRKELNWFVLIIASIALICCEKSEIEQTQQTKTLIFPIGRSSYEANTYKTLINDSVYTPKVIVDSNNGYWLEFLRSDLEDFQTIQIQFTRKQQDLALFHEESSNTSRWLSPSFYIDSDNEKIKAKANEIAQHVTTNTNLAKAKRIHAFVIGHLNLNFDLKHTFYHKASATLDLRQGNCMNYSRLFVALCRAANIPSRTIWGVVYGYGSGTRENYNFHHQWAEILDDDNNWRVLDLTMTTVFDINDIRYLDLIYAAEENDRVHERDLKEIMMSSLKYENEYPASHSGLYLNNGEGFNLITDNYPDSLTTGYTYTYNGSLFKY